MEAWAMAHPWLTFFLLLAVIHVLYLPFRLMNRWIRHRNIVARGWPPEHLDADGDVVKLEDRPKRQSRTIMDA